MLVAPVAVQRRRDNEKSHVIAVVAPGTQHEGGRTRPSLRAGRLRAAIDSSQGTIERATSSVKRGSRRLRQDQTVPTVVALVEYAVAARIGVEEHEEVV